MHKAFLIAMTAGALLLCRPSIAQEPVDPAPPAAQASDPLLEQIGAGMDDIDRRREAAEADTGAADRVGGPSMAPNFVQGLLALSFVIALILIAYWALQRWGKRVPMLAGAHLGKVLGRVYLDRGTTLHFVQVGEKVLLVGVNANSVSLLGEFSSTVFNGHASAPAMGGAAVAPAPFNPDSFLAELRTRSAQFAQTERVPRAEEDEIASLRGDIQRLQRYLREENREHED